MALILAAAAAAFSLVAALFALLAFLRAKPAESPAQAIRTEADRIRADAAEQARSLRQELGDSITRFQTAAEARQDAGLEQLTAPIASIGQKLDLDMARMASEAAQNRESLRQTIEGRLDAAAQQGQDAARALREELTANFDKTSRLLAETVKGFGDHQHQRLSEMKQQLADLSDREAAAGETLRKTVEAKLDASDLQAATGARELRAELTGNFGKTSEMLSNTLSLLGESQHQRLEKMEIQLATMADRQAAGGESLRLTLETRLDKLREENSAKLDEMRNTVDEKLQSTLERRLTESFQVVQTQLENVHKGLGEMQSLATGVGDLKRVLTNVKTRGTWGEVQLGMLLEQFLLPDQYLKNAQVKEGSLERVEFAVRFPGQDGEKEVLLPIDAKFPQEDYERLAHAAERADAVAVEEAAAALEARVKSFARTMSGKYINPPITTDFAILFLPTESLFAEVLRRPGLFEQLQHDCRVTLAGPTTLSAMLSAFQLGFRSLAIQKRSSEVWQILGAVKTEFAQHGKVVDTLKKQLNTAAGTIDRLGTRTRAMTRSLRNVEALPGKQAEALLQLPAEAEPDDEASEDMAE